MPLHPSVSVIPNLQGNLSGLRWFRFANGAEVKAEGLFKNNPEKAGGMAQGRGQKMRKETAERIAKEFLRAHYPNGSPDFHAVEPAPSPFEYSVSGRINIGDLRPLWASFKILVNIRTEEVEDYEIVRDRA